MTALLRNTFFIQFVKGYHLTQSAWTSFIPVRVSSVDDFSTQDTYLEQIYLLLHIIESRL
jgi:hypothetical protein